MHKQLIRQLKLKIILFIALKYAIHYLTISGLILGVAVLVLRVGFLISGPVILLTLICLLPGIIQAIILARKNSPSETQLYAFLDRQNSCGGILMTGNELDISSWEKHIPAITIPGIKWSNIKKASVFAVVVIFAGISFFIPQKYMVLTSENSLDISDDVKKLQTSVETLSRQDIISEEKTVQLKQKLDQLTHDASGIDPVKTWEALDHISQNIKKEAEQAAASAGRQAEKLSETQMLAKGLSENARQLKKDFLSDAMKELSNMTQSLLAENKLLEKNISPDLSKAAKQRSINAEQLKELMNAIKKTKSDLSRSMEELHNSGLIDAKKIGVSKKKKNKNARGLMQFLSKNSTNVEISDAVPMYFSDPGKGGASRGRADSSMTWTDGSSEDGTSFKEEALPASSMAALKKSRLIGISRGANVVEINRNMTQYSVLNPVKSNTGQAITHTILPRHKGTVKRYFKRQ